MFEIIGAFIRVMGRIMGNLYRNDRTAFLIALAAFVGGFYAWPSGLYWLAFLGYVGCLHALQRRGEGLELVQSVKRASDACKGAEPQTEPQQQTPQEPPSEGPQDPPKDSPIQELTDTGKEAVQKTIRFTKAFLSDEERAAAETPGGMAAMQQRDAVIDIALVEEFLRRTIRGQDSAVDAVIATLKRAAAGLKVKKDSPICVFLFLGPTGTGKTELVKQLAAALGRHLVRFDMPNFNNEHGVWELIGSPPGYVGSDKAGHLTGEIRSNPDAVLLLDEIEKAYPKIWDPFLRVLDEGKLKDQAQGFTADFRNVMIFLTSNLLAHEDYTADEKQLRNLVLNSGYFRPELLNRIDRIVMFRHFDTATLHDIAAGTLTGYLQMFVTASRLDVDIDIDVRVVPFILRNVDTKFGARDIQRFIEKHIGDKLADGFLDARAVFSSFDAITVQLNEDQADINIEFSGKISGGGSQE